MRLKIENPIERDFGMVPRAIWQMDLPFAAKGLACYLFCCRDGAVPYVAEIEAACGIGRDARRKAFAALEAAGVIEWRVELSGRRIVGKTLVLHPAACRAPENQAHAETVNAPDFPAGGKPVDLSTENRPSSDCRLGDTLKEKKQRARGARDAVGNRRSASSARVPSRKPDPWSRARSAADAGLQWLDPVSGRWRAASEFPDAVQCSSGAPVAGSG